MKTSSQFDLLFIRHGESQYNQFSSNFLQKHQLSPNWEVLSKNDEYLKNCKYSSTLVDCFLTEKGPHQCETIRQKAKTFQPDVILVSPLNRALQTCTQIFDNLKCEIIAEPILSESLRSSCDFSSNIEVKKNKFPHVNFKKVEALGKFWFLERESKQNKLAYFKVLTENEDKNYEQQIEAQIKLGYQTHIYESCTNLRQQAEQMKLLLRGYKAKYNRVAVVCHFNVIKYILATQFDKNDEPKHHKIKNCELLLKNVQDLQVLSFD